MNEPTISGAACVLHSQCPTVLSIRHGVFSSLAFQEFTLVKAEISRDKTPRLNGPRLSSPVTKEVHAAAERIERPQEGHALH